MSDFIPRISIPDQEDASTVALALTEYAGSVTRRGALIGDLRGMVEEVQRVMTLIDSIVNQAEAQCAEATFGSLPDDEEIAETLEKLAGEFREGDNN